MKSMLVYFKNSSLSQASFNLKMGMFLIILGCLLFSSKASSQTDKALRKANDYLAQHKAKLGLSDLDVADLLVSSAYTDDHNGLTHVYVQQRHNGIEIKNAILGLHYKSDGDVLHVASNLEKKLATRLRKGNASLSPVQAVQAAAQSLSLQAKSAPAVLSSQKNAAQETVLSKAGISQNDIPAKLVYVVTEDGSLRLAWQVQIYSMNAQNYWVVEVDAQSGKVLSTQDLVIKCTFNHEHSAGNCSAVASPNHQITKSLIGMEKATAAFDFFPQSQENISSVFSQNAPGIASDESLMVGNFYRVYEAPIEAPSFGSRTFMNTNGDPAASPFGWHHDGTIPFSITRGNNVYAYEDKLGVNAGTSPSGGVPGGTLIFDYPINFNQQPGTYTNAAVTNLFFWNNHIHDVLWHYGFTAPAGNFQFNNAGQGGVGADPVHAEAQDGGGMNNANFLTLPDGVPGRMQMYLWSSNAEAELVHINNSSSYPLGGVHFSGIPAAFGPAITTTGVTGQLVIVEANQNMQVACTNDCGCGTGQGVGLPPNNDVVGKIVLIDRGGCTFIEKVMGAQLGGAAGVIVINNVPGGGAIAMGGAAENGANAITIPSCMISYEDGLELKDEIALGLVNVSIKRLTPAPANKDGDLDNGIITHEYGHGISNRLTGGPGPHLGCLGGDEQAGEGWSDFFALMLTMNPETIVEIGEEGRGVGSYVFDQPTDGLGIRPAKYSTDLNVNGYTYEDIANTEISVPHGVGFIFCTALWEMTIALIDHYGYDEDITSGALDKGNTLALQLVIDGLKLQPCSPTFLQSRDAILAADEALTGGINQCMIWEAFAKRGMGYSATSGTNARGNENEAFDTPPTCLANVHIVKSAASQIGNGQQLTYTLTVTNVGGALANSVVVTDPIPAGTSYVAGSASNGGTLVGGVVTYPAFSLNPTQSVTRTFNVSVNTAGASNLVFNDNMEDGVNNWVAAAGVNQFNFQDVHKHSGSYAWFANDPDNASNQTLDIAAAVPLTANSQLRFWHKYQTESGFDGGLVELSPDGGTTWYNLGSQIIQNGYNDFIPLANNPLINGFAFGGSSGGWIETVVNLGSFAGQEAIIRFRFSSDVATPGVGWAIDDVVIGSSITFVNNTASFLTGGGQTGSSSVSTLVVPGGQNAGVIPGGEVVAQPNNPGSPIVNSQQPIINWQLTAYPNPAKEVVYLKLVGELSGEAHLQVMNAQGQMMQQQIFQAEEAAPVLSFDASNLPDGIFWLNLHDNLNTQTVRLVIQRN